LNAVWERHQCFKMRLKRSETRIGTKRPETGEQSKVITGIEGKNTTTEVNNEKDITNVESGVA